MDPKVGSVASLFISRWDKGSADQLPEELHNRLGIAAGQKTYRAYRELLASERWNKLASARTRQQRLLRGSPGTKDPHAPDQLYTAAIDAPHTLNPTTVNPLPPSATQATCR